MNGQLLAGCPVPLCVLPVWTLPCLVLYDTGVVEVVVDGRRDSCEGVRSKLQSKSNRSFCHKRNTKRKSCVKAKVASGDSVFHLFMDNGHVPATGQHASYSGLDYT